MTSAADTLQPEVEMQRWALMVLALAGELAPPEPAAPGPARRHYAPAGDDEDAAHAPLQTFSESATERRNG